MKKKPIMILAAAALILLLLCIALLYMSLHSLGFSSGRFLAINDTTFMLIIEDNAPILLANTNDNDDLFTGLTSGDQILVLHDGIQETYPARTGAYRIWKRSDGTMNDISEDVIVQLKELGWLPTGSEPDTPPLPTPEPQDDILPEPEANYISVYANWSDSDLIYTCSLNRDSMAISGVRHLPVYRLDTLSDVEEFHSRFRNLYDMDGYLEVTGAYQEDFFAANSLVLVYVSSGSGTYRFGVSEIKADHETFSVVIEQLNFPEVVTDDMAGWFIIVEAEDSILNHRIIDAYMRSQINR